MFSAIKKAVLGALEGLPHRHIFGVDGLYLTRWNLGDVGPARVYLHRFNRGDEDKELHNHPWAWAFSLMLAGGYVEHRLCSQGIVWRRVVRPGAVNVIRANDFHKVELRGGPAWTLFVTGPKAQSWGFLDPLSREFTPWREFLRQKELDAEQHANPAGPKAGAA